MPRRWAIFLKLFIFNTDSCEGRKISGLVLFAWESRSPPSGGEFSLFWSWVYPTNPPYHSRRFNEACHSQVNSRTVSHGNARFWMQETAKKIRKLSFHIWTYGPSGFFGECQKLWGLYFAKASAPGFEDAIFVTNSPNIFGIFKTAIWDVFDPLNPWVTWRQSPKNLMSRVLIQVLDFGDIPGSWISSEALLFSQSGICRYFQTVWRFPSLKGLLWEFPYSGLHCAGMFILTFLISGFNYFGPSV